MASCLYSVPESGPRGSRLLLDTLLAPLFAMPLLPPSYFTIEFVFDFLQEVFIGEHVYRCSSQAFSNSQCQIQALSSSASFGELRAVRSGSLFSRPNPKSCAQTGHGIADVALISTGHCA